MKSAESRDGQEQDSNEGAAIFEGGWDSGKTLNP
jgi:hypothetical protein